MQGSFIIGVFDCCRADFKPPEEHRGGVPGLSEIDDGSSTRNCVLTFGCQPNSAVSAVSTLAREYLQRLSQSPDGHGNIIFPSLDFLKWTPGEGGEHIPLF